MSGSRTSTGITPRGPGKSSTGGRFEQIVKVVANNPQIKHGPWFDVGFLSLCPKERIPQVSHSYFFFDRNQSPSNKEPQVLYSRVARGGFDPIRSTFRRQSCDDYPETFRDEIIPSVLSAKVDVYGSNGGVVFTDYGRKTLHE